MELTAEAFMRTLDRPGLEHVQRGHRAAEPTSPIRSARCCRFSEWARRRVAARRRARSPSGWSRAPTWRWSASRPRCAAGRRRPTRPSSRPTPTTSACSTRCMKPENLAAVRRGRRLAQPVRSGLRPGAGARAQRAGQGAVRDARRHGQPPAPRAVRAVAQPAALRAGLPQGEFPQRHRLPHPPARREHRARRTSCAMPSSSRSAARSGSSWSRASSARSTRSPTRQRCAAPHAGPPAAAARADVRDRARLAASRERAGHRLLAAAERRVGGADRREVAAALRRPAPCRSRWSSPARRSLEGRTVRDCLDPSRPGVVVGRYRQATEADVERAVDCAAADAGRLADDAAPSSASTLLGRWRRSSARRAAT